MTGGHGWVYPRPDGTRARCAGPSVCADCMREELNGLRWVRAAAVTYVQACRAPSVTNTMAGAYEELEMILRTWGGLDD